MNIDSFISTIDPNTHLFFFDMDGVLCNSESINVAAYKLAAQFIYQKYSLKGVLFDELIFSQCVSGKTYAIAFQNLLKYYPGLYRYATEFEQLTFDYFHMLRDKNLDSFLIQASVDFFQYLVGEQYRMAIVSGSMRRDIQFILDLMQLGHAEVLIIGDEDYTHGKPHPEPYLKAAEFFSVSTNEQCVVVEDSVYGVEAAKKANMKAIQLTGGLESSSSVSPLADWTLRSLAELTSIQS